MNFKLVSSAFALILTLSFSTFAYASGGGGGGGGGGGFGGGTYNRSAPPRQVDQSYEYGKAIYQGRQQGFKKIAYCLDIDGEKVPLKSRTIKHFKRTPINDFANSLYDCNAPDQRVRDQLSRDKLQYVLYYLNKRYKLSLS